MMEKHKRKIVFILFSLISNKMYSVKKKFVTAWLKITNEGKVKFTFA